MLMDSEDTIETTLEDLIAALTEEAMKVAGDEKAAHKVVAFALTHLVYNPGANSQMWH